MKIGPFLPETCMGALGTSIGGVPLMENSWCSPKCNMVKEVHKASAYTHNVD